MKKFFVWVLTSAVLLIGNININAAQNSSDNVIWLEPGVGPALDGIYNSVIDDKYVGGFHDGLASVRNDWISNDFENSKYGYVNGKGEIAIPLEYSNTLSFDNGIAKVYKERYPNNVSNYYIDINNKRIEKLEILKEYDETDFFYNGMAKVKKGDKYGYVNTDGELVVPVHYDNGGYFSEGKCFVKRNDTWFCIDESGNEIFSLPNGYHPIGCYKEGKVSIGTGQYSDQYNNIEYYCFFDDKGNKLFDAGTYGWWMPYFSENRVVIVNPNEDSSYSYSVVDEKGNTIIEKNIYSRISHIKNGHAWALKEGDETIYILDSNGNVTKEIEGYENPNWDAMYQRFELAATDKKSGLQGMFDENGDILIPFEYDSVWSYISENKVFVKKGDLWGIYNLENSKDDNMITIYGDADFDGKVTVNDASVTLSKILDNNNVIKLEKETGDYKKYLDVDNDDILTATDVAIILRKALEKDSFIMPVEK